MRKEYAHKRDGLIISKLLDMPWFFITTICVISFVGFMALYSAAKGNIDPWALAQMQKFFVGFVLMIMVGVTNIRFWFSVSYLAYLGGIALLLAVMFFGVEGGLGAQRWLKIGGFAFQPSEIMKIVLVMALARYFHNVHHTNIKRLWVVFVPILLIVTTAFLVFKQPNLGTALIIMIVGASVMLMAGVGWKKFAVAALVVLAFVPVVWGHMHDYQKKRVEIFLNPQSDPLGAGYNIIQSKIAIGSGGFFGKGFLNGTQSQLSFVPEKQTDFIFSIIAEEFGFVGSMAVILVYLMLIISGMHIAIKTKSLFAKLMAYGVVSIIFVHVFVNIGMVSGILPVVGVPLPLISYGGSSIISVLVGFGFVINAHVYRQVQIPQI